MTGSSGALDGGASPRTPWPLVAVVLAAMALLHVGVGLVLTRSARADIAAIEQAWSAAELSEAAAPGAQPEGLGAEFAAWTRAQRCWDDAQKLTERRAQVSALTLGLGGSFALQAVFVVFLALRAARCARRR